MKYGAWWMVDFCWLAYHVPVSVRRPLVKKQFNVLCTKEQEL